MYTQKENKRLFGILSHVGSQMLTYYTESDKVTNTQSKRSDQRNSASTLALPHLEHYVILRILIIAK